LILALYDHPHGVETSGGNLAVYDLEANTAHFGAASVPGHALVWKLEEQAADGGEKLAARVELDPGSDWLLRCDRVDFPPGGIAHRHTHPGPGIRCLLHGSIRIESGGETHAYHPLEPWFEAGPEPVLAVASEAEETAFVRAMLVPREWAGKRTIRYVDPADDDKPKLQRATVFFDEPIEL
jgi:quercetin dioxygenase-like cupin family protein